MSGGGGLLDGLQMRAALTSGFFSGEAGRRPRAAGCAPSGVDAMRQDSSAALRDVGRLAGGRPAAARRGSARRRGAARPVVADDLMATLESQDGRVRVHRAAPVATSPTSACRPPARLARRAGVRLVGGDLTPYAAEVAQTIAAAVAGDDGGPR